MIDLAHPLFWLVSAAGILVLVPVRSAELRRWLLAAVNAAFLISLLNWRSIELAASVIVVYVILVGVARRSRLLLTLALAGVFGVFVLHKLPALASRVGLGAMSQTLAVIGYSYVALRMVEVLRAVFERRHRAPDLVSLVNYLLPFHMLAAGPIQAYDEFVQQPAVPQTRSGRDVLVGVERVTAGLFKKFVLAFVIQKLFLTDFTATGIYRVIEIQAFFVWLFLDFSAYSDIASGIGGLLGVATPENFNRPLLARNIVDFWERWHISLSTFIRRNVFIPIQIFLMRQNDARTPLLSAVIAIVIAFVLCGLWHGLTRGFLLWGFAQAFGLVVARVYAHVLQERLGRKGVKAYLANSWIAAAATVVTFEFEACVQITLFIK